MKRDKPGRPPSADPKGGKSQPQVRFPPDLLAQVDEAATKEGISRNAWILRACKAWLRTGPKW